MSVSPEFKEFILEQLEPLSETMGPVSIRRFFGGAAIVFGSVQFAMIMGQTLYLRVDDSNRSDYEDAGMKPFSYMKKDKRVFVKKYSQLPEELLDDQDELLEHYPIDVAHKPDATKKPRRAKRVDTGN